MGDNEDQDSAYIAPENIGFFDFVEVEKNANSQDEQNGSDAAEADEMEFAFPLFSTNPSFQPGNGTATSDKEDLRSQLMVSLRDASEDVDAAVLKHNQEQSSKRLGTTAYTASELTQFRSLAVDFDSIFLHNFKYHNKKSNSAVEVVLVDSESNNKPYKTRKPGQRQRQAKKLGLQRELERKTQEAEMKKLIKKKFHKRGGKRNSSKPKQVNKVVKFRTE